MKFNLRYLYLPMLIMALTFFVACDDDDPAPADVVDDTADMVEDPVPDVEEDVEADAEEDAEADVFVDTGFDLFEDADATPPPTVTCTFTIDTTSTADGTNALADVPDDFDVYIAGNAFGNWGEFNTPQWDPRYPENVLTDNNDGTFSIDYDVPAGMALEFKFLINNEPAGTTNGWNNGEKDWADVTGGSTCGSGGDKDCACTNASADTTWLTEVGIAFGDMTGGLWEISNRTELVPDDDSTTHTFDTYMIEAWRDYASYTYDYYHSCD